jgi:hypothetical protein
MEEEHERPFGWAFDVNFVERRKENSDDEEAAAPPSRPMPALETYEPDNNAHAAAEDAVLSAHFAGEAQGGNTRLDASTRKTLYDELETVHGAVDTRGCELKCVHRDNDLPSYIVALRETQMLRNRFVSPSQRGAVLRQHNLCEIEWRRECARERYARGKRLESASMRTAGMSSANARGVGAGWWPWAEHADLSQELCALGEGSAACALLRLQQEADSDSKWFNNVRLLDIGVGVGPDSAVGVVMLHGDMTPWLYRRQRDEMQQRMRAAIAQAKATVPRGVHCVVALVLCDRQLHTLSACAQLLKPSAVMVADGERVLLPGCPVVYGTPGRHDEQAAWRSFWAALLRHQLTPMQLIQSSVSQQSAATSSVRKKRIVKAWVPPPRTLRKQPLIDAVFGEKSKS